MFCPVLPAFEAVAHTLVHDAKIAGDFSLPTERMASVTVPTLMIYGGRPPTQALVDAIPDARFRTLEGQPHNVDPAALAPVLVEFFGS
jgi:hypothetical protein